MKRYMAFVGKHYYPDGGIDDFVGDFDCLEDAIKKIISEITIDYESDSEVTFEEYFSNEKNWFFYHIYDTVERKKVEIKL